MSGEKSLIFLIPKNWRHGYVKAIIRHRYYWRRQRGSISRHGGLFERTLIVRMANLALNSDGQLIVRDRCHVVRRDWFRQRYLKDSVYESLGLVPAGRINPITKRVYPDAVSRSVDRLRPGPACRARVTSDRDQSRERGFSCPRRSREATVTKWGEPSQTAY